MTTLALLFVGATVLASLTPGPAVLLVVSVSLRRGWRAAARAIFGICAGSLVYVMVALTGLIAAVTTHRALLRQIQLAGAAYLAYLGVRAVLSALTARTGPAAARATAEADHQRPFVEGTVTQLSNPKSIVYWTALLPPFLDASRPVRPQLLWMGAVGIVVDVIVLLGYALGAARIRQAMERPAARRLLDAVAGAIFVVLGLLLALVNLRS